MITYGFSRKYYNCKHCFIPRTVPRTDDPQNAAPGKFTTCESLLEDSGSYLTESSIFQIHESAQVGLDKLVIGKTAAPEDVFGDAVENGFLNASYFNTCLEQAADKDWSMFSFFGLVCRTSLIAALLEYLDAGVMLWQASVLKYSLATTDLMVLQFSDAASQWIEEARGSVFPIESD